MARDQVDMTPIETRDELVAWFAEGCKPKADYRIGTEHEKFAFTVEGHRPVPYEGRRSIRALLDGMPPNWSLADMPMMPKGRYRIMTAYMPKVGTLGLDMMYRTCTVQTNLDFFSEADMVKKLRVSLALQPVATAIFSNSPFTEGKPNGLVSFRSEIWRDTDPDRSGMR